MKQYLLFPLLLLFGALGAQTSVGSFEYDGEIRTYRVFTPISYTGDLTDRPLVFNLHGFGSNAFQQEFYSTMNAVADTAGFFVCYPDGVDASWNVGWSFGSTQDDVGFINALIDTLANDLSIDTNRVYSTGMSNGGFMSYRLACELSDRIVAVASVTGSMVPGTLAGCDPGRSVPVMQIHGTDDETVPYEGGNISIAIDDLMPFWLGKNDCATQADTIDVPDTDPNDGSTAQRIEWTDCDGDTEVVLYKIQNGEHTWPGASLTLGVTNRDISASVEIWEFFNRYAFESEPVNTERPRLATPTWTLAPNPVSDWLRIGNLPAEESLVSIFDARGALLFRQSVRHQLELPIDFLPGGVLTVSVLDATGHLSSQRLVVLR